MIMAELNSIPRRLAATAIILYQRTLSPDHGWLLRGRYPYGFCRFYPSCSEYGKAAILRHGVIKGGARALWRVARCNPWTPPSIEINN